VKKLKVKHKKTPYSTGVISLITLLPTEKSILVNLTQPEWNTLVESLVEIDNKLEKMGINA
jgi:hypothetical protein